MQTETGVEYVSALDTRIFGFRVPNILFNKICLWLSDYNSKHEDKIVASEFGRAALMTFLKRSPDVKLEWKDVETT